MTIASRPRPVILCILDGWGHSSERENNAILQAETPHWDRFLATCPHALLDASAEQVGLPAGQMGNSEVGHMNLGAGRIVLQDLPRINEALKSGALAANPALGELIARLRKSGGVCHLMGLLSPGGVHSHQDHIAALAQTLCKAGVPVALHAFLDGRDTPPSSALNYMERLLADTRDLEGFRIATVSGRYFAMDRDSRWDRVALAYQALVLGDGAAAPDPLTAIQNSYAAGVTDEFMRPTAIAGYGGMKDGDGLLMANFRADRARQILEALCAPAFDGFARPAMIDFAARAGMVKYSGHLAAYLSALFPPQTLDSGLGQTVAEAGLHQLRIAETEKYAHVTFFLNGGEEGEFPGEERILVPSPKVATYDLQPEMSAAEVTDKLVAAIEQGRFDLIVVNYANPDMVGHTGIMAAAIKAVETIDHCLGQLEAAVAKAGGCMLVTADHGNIEQMSDAASGQPHTAHTTFRVPAVLISPPQDACTLKDGRLADVAPTLLALMGLPQPAAMTGHSLLGSSTTSARHALA